MAMRAMAAPCTRVTFSFRKTTARTTANTTLSLSIGDHEEKYTGKHEDKTGDEQFEIADTRSIRSMYGDMEHEGLQPVLNDYLYV